MYLVQVKLSPPDSESKTGTTSRFPFFRVPIRIPPRWACNNDNVTNSTTIMHINYKVFGRTPGTAIVWAGATC